MIYINTRFPKTKKAYTKQANDNTDKLKSIMEKLVLHEQSPAESSALKPAPQGGRVAYSYAERSKKPKTFKLV